MQKEFSEWIQTWCDSTTLEDLPRVLLVGDSITRGYERFVREKLRGVAYVDYMATSYAVDSPIYEQLLKSLLGDSRYDLIHFNHGLHGIHMSKHVYEKNMAKVIEGFGTQRRVILALTTFVFEAGNQKPSIEWGDKVNERNAVVLHLAKEYQMPIDDLYSVSVKLPKEFRWHDGTHYTDEGYRVLSETVVATIRENLL